MKQPFIVLALASVICVDSNAAAFGILLKLLEVPFEVVGRTVVHTAGTTEYVGRSFTTIPRVFTHTEPAIGKVLDGGIERFSSGEKEALRYIDNLSSREKEALIHGLLSDDSATRSRSLQLLKDVKEGKYVSLTFQGSLREHIVEKTAEQVLNERKDVVREVKVITLLPSSGPALERLYGRPVVQSESESISSALTKFRDFGDSVQISPESANRNWLETSINKVVGPDRMIVIIAHSVASTDGRTLIFPDGSRVLVDNLVNRNPGRNIVVMTCYSEQLGINKEISPFEALALSKRLIERVKTNPGRYSDHIALLTQEIKLSQDFQGAIHAATGASGLASVYVATSRVIEDGQAPRGTVHGKASATEPRSYR